MEPTTPFQDFVDYIKENVLKIETDRLVKPKKLPKLNRPVYCTVVFTGGRAICPVKLADVKKSVAFVLGNESSVGLTQCPLWQWLLNAGYDPNYLVNCKRNGFKPWLIFFQVPDNVLVQPAHWEGVIDYVHHYYPDVYMAVHTHAFRVRQNSLDVFEKDLGHKFDKSLDDQTLFMSYDKLRGRFPEKHLPPSVAETRLFLYCQMNLDENFHGDGFVRKWDHSRGSRQYILPNLSIVGDKFEVVPFDYQIPQNFTTM